MPIRKNETPYQRHVKKWKNCTDCELCEVRRNVVLCRGSLPCEVLFVGEAPGESEDVLGRPFVGPAGKLLDHIISHTDIPEDKIAFTNLVACVPKDEGSTKKMGQPPRKSIDACAGRLLELVRIAKPSMIVWVGALAEKHGPEAVKNYKERVNNQLVECGILHPAAILRADVSQKGLAVQRCVASIQEAYEDLIPF